MRPDTSVLMVVDVQNGFLMETTCHVLPAIEELVDQWQKVEGRAIYSRYFNYPGSTFERLMDWRHLHKPPDTEIANSLLPYVQNEITLDKRGYSAATQGFLELAERHGWTDVVICGIDTELCVLKTAMDVFEFDLTPWVVTDACASTGGDSFHEAGLAVLGRAIGDHHLVTLDSLFTDILTSE